MTDERTALEEFEFDLMAYADGLLEDDPARKARIEAHVESFPEDAARVAALRAQNAALRRRYGRRIEDPVPQRLYDVLERRGTAAGAPAAKAAAVVALTVTAALSGWWLGRAEPTTPWPPHHVLDSDLIGAMEPDAPAAPADKVADASDQPPMNWLSERISLNLRTPDLSDQGYTLTAKETVHVAGGRMVRLTYGGPDGRGFNLLLRPWWETRSPRIELVKRGEVWVAYWREGPLATALAARLPRNEVHDLARSVRRGLQDRNRSTPDMRAKPPASGLPGLADGSTGDAASTLGAPGEPRPTPASSPQRTN